MSEKNPNLNTQIITYVHPKYHKLFIADCHATISGKAEKLRQIINLSYDPKKQK